MKPAILLSVLLVLIIDGCVAPPVSQNKEKEENGDEHVNGLEDYMEYHRYLKEVVNALESDPEFRKKLEKAEEHEIRSGQIAEQLEFVSHHVRTRLDEIKRIELDRLKDLTEKKRKLMENIDDQDPTHHHLDHSNPHTFEIEDLKKLIAKTTEDLAEADKKRRDEFKQYELQKEYEKQDKLNHTNGSEREKLEKEIQEQEEKHKKHEKLHEPGHKAQLEEVWEEQDQMQQDFDPKTFFMLHDLDGNGLWDQDEVKSLFIKELDKMYQQGAPEDDMRERIEEMERMRESVFREIDTNRDGFIDYQEFLSQTKSNDFKQDHGWQGLDEQKPYSDDELAEYIRQHQANQMRQGYPPHYPNPNYPQQPPPGYYMPPPAGHQQPYPNVGPPPNQQFHPQNPPQMQGHHPNDINSNSVYGNQPPNYQQQVHHPQANYHPQQHQQQPNAHAPQGSYQPNHQQGQPQQNAQHPNQVNYQQPQGYQMHGQQQQPPVQNQQQKQPPIPQQQNNQQLPVAKQQNNQQPPVPQQQQNNQQPPVPHQQQNIQQLPVPHQQQNIQQLPVQQQQNNQKAPVQQEPNKQQQQLNVPHQPQQPVQGQQVKQNLHENANPQVNAI